MKEIAVPRHDFYQTDAHVIVSIYIKGYGAPEVKDQVKVSFEAVKITVELPKLNDDGEAQRFVLDPLFAAINPEQSSFRVLGTKIELKLIKAYPTSWSAVIHDGTAAAAPPVPGPSTQRFDSAPPPTALQAKKERRNWDKFVDDELNGEQEEVKDPNAGGDAALKEFFSQLYKDADEDTRRAMIKSYTESGGTTLSTNWDEIGKEKTPIRPPEGMEAKKY
ncbi:SGS domain-containing protein [Papiliotrema laurentii]|uniref:SGS domain-containing protein n=1 Tax=Papiliotrema laurentii TaxID=5418 RepID=A0AAD9FT67_PAPLA|nr:SGS domain-containing protein [Papiliotrema laurentii]